MFWLLLTRVASVIRMPAVMSGGFKRVATDALITSATIYAVDNVTDAFDGSDDDSITEGVVDIVLGLVLASRGRVAFGRASSAGRNLRLTAKAKFLEVKELLKTIPLVSPALMSSVLKTKPRAMQWVRDSVNQTLSAFDKRTGELLAVLDRKGWRLGTGGSLKGLTMSRGNALGYAGLFTAGATIPLFILETLELQVETMVNVSEGGTGATSRRRMLPQDEEDAKLSFLRDPDMWLDAFGKGDMTTSEKTDRAIAWLFESESRSVMEWDPSVRSVRVESSTTEKGAVVSKVITEVNEDANESTLEQDDANTMYTGGLIDSRTRVELDRAVAERKARAAVEELYTSESSKPLF